jgi:hypothetical protein
MPQVRDVHRATLAATRSRRLAVDLGHHLDRIHAFRDAMAMAAMRARDVVVVAQVHAETGGRGFFAGVQVHEAGNGAGGEFRMHPLLELADRAHRAIGLHELRVRKLTHLVSSLLDPSAAARAAALLGRRHAEPSARRHAIACSRKRTRGQAPSCSPITGSRRFATVLA